MLKTWEGGEAGYPANCVNQTPELLYILRIRPATPHTPWQAILKDPRTEKRRTFSTALELARHLVILSESSTPRVSLNPPGEDL